MRHDIAQWQRVRVWCWWWWCCCCLLCIHMLRFGMTSDNPGNIVLCVTHLGAYGTKEHHVPNILHIHSIFSEFQWSSVYFENCIYKFKMQSLQSEWLAGCWWGFETMLTWHLCNRKNNNNLVPQSLLFAIAIVYRVETQ